MIGSSTSHENRSAIGWRKRASIFLQSPYWQILVFAVVVSFCLMRAYIGVAGINGYSHDLFFLCDGAWRMENGQRPHIDFYSMVGVLAYVPTLVGLAISSNRVQGFGYGQALVGLVLGAWAFAVARKRLGSIATALFTIAATLIAVAPFELGGPASVTGPATTYNRYGYVLIALVLVEAFTSLREINWSRLEMWGGISTGAVLSVLLFLKITYFVAGLCLVIALCLCRNQTKSRWLGILVGFTLPSLLLCGYFSFNLSPTIHDLTLVMHARHINFRIYSLLDLAQSAALLAVLIVSAGLYVRAEARLSARPLFLLSVFGPVAGLLLILGNYQESDLTLSIFILIVILDAILRGYRSAGGNPFRISLILICSVLIGSSIAYNLSGLGWGVVHKFRDAPNAPAGDAPRLHGFVPIRGDAVYTAFVNDGIHLLRAHIRPGETVMSLDFSNPFSYGLGIPPAPGGTTGIQYKSTFNDQYKQSAQALFGCADLVMSPKNTSDASLDESIPRLYGGYLSSHYHLVADSPDWRLYRRTEEYRGPLHACQG